MNFVSYNTLYRDLVNLALKLPPVDVVVGIPRSGMIPASILATHMNARLGVITGGSVSIFKGGVRDQHAKPNTVLVIDDSIDSGATFETVRQVFSSSQFNIKTAAVYATPGSEGLVDFYGRVLRQPRMFAWNFMNHGLLRNACVDIDGVMCVDPTVAENDDGMNYMMFLNNAQVLRLPKFPINTIVTCRLSKYREQTELWLHKHGIKWNNLVMMNYSSAQARQIADKYSEFKAEHYRASGCEVFIESSAFQARRIAQITGKPVISVENLMLYGGSESFA